jgi:phosphomannomutase
MSELLVSVSGVRGVVGETLTADVALRFAAAFGTFLKPGKVVVGGDTRRTGPMVKSAAIAGLMDSGHDVVDIGICPTPSIEMAVRDGGFIGGIAITASHNPDKYNALKLIGPGGLFLSQTQGSKVKEIFQGNRSKNASWTRAGTLSCDDRWIEYHIDKILGLDIISANVIGKRGLAVVADCVGGTAALIAGGFFSRLGVKHDLINSTISGKFPHGPEPVPENLRQLGEAVRKLNADIGFAFDPDADRLAIVSETGQPLGEEYTLALGCRYILRHTKGPLAINVSSSLLNDFVAREAGVKLFRTPVGERNVTEKLMRTGGVAGGEGNGGLIYPSLHWGRDAFLAAAIILQYLSSSGKTISELARELPCYVMLKTRMNITRQDVERKTKAIGRLFPGAKVDTLDGIKLSGNDWWVQIRASNTEPIARLMAEATDLKKARGLVRTMKAVFRRK